MNAIVSSKKLSPLVILRREYLEIANGNFCAAKLIEYFRHWTQWKIKVHRTDWIYQPLKNIYADLMGEHSLHAIRAAIALIQELGILNRRKNPGNQQDKTWQYQINFNALNSLLESRKFKTEPSTFNVEQHQQITNPYTSEPQQNTVVEEEKTLEVDWEEVEQQVKQWEASQLTVEPTNSEEPIVSHSEAESLLESPSSDINPHEDNSPDGDDTNKLNLTIHYNRDSQIDEDSDIETTPQPSREELREVFQQLRGLPCTPIFRLNSQIQSIVAKYWHNVPGAIAYTKEAIATWKKIDSVPAVFVKACQEGRKPENWNKPKKEFSQPTPEQLEQLKSALAKREITDFYQLPDGLWIVDTGKSAIAWWEFVLFQIFVDGQCNFEWGAL